MLSVLASVGGSKYLYLFMLMDLVTLCSALCMMLGLYVHLSLDGCWFRYMPFEKRTDFNNAVDVFVYIYYGHSTTVQLMLNFHAFYILSYFHLF